VQPPSHIGIGIRAAKKHAQTHTHTERQRAGG
jgi:hypothetical protein